MRGWAIIALTAPVYSRKYTTVLTPKYWTYQGFITCSLVTRGPRQACSIDITLAGALNLRSAPYSSLTSRSSTKTSPHLQFRSHSTYPNSTSTLPIAETMKSGLPEKDLKAAISSTLRRQHLLGAVPAAQRLLPLTAFAIGDLLLARESGSSNRIENLLCGSDSAQIQLQSPPSTELQRQHTKQVSMTAIIESCRICSRMHRSYVIPYTARAGGKLEMYGNWTAAALA